jgi:hypothetical protein
MLERGDAQEKRISSEVMLEGTVRLGDTLRTLTMTRLNGAGRGKPGEELR